MFSREYLLHLRDANAEKKLFFPEFQKRFSYSHSFCPSLKREFNR